MALAFGRDLKIFAFSDFCGPLIGGHFRIGGSVELIVNIPSERSVFISIPIGLNCLAYCLAPIFRSLRHNPPLGGFFCFGLGAA